ncbi:SMI1/KNR4 family protein [Deinococcus lacus]|uniref:SMI1/KNR4 family protein n=1 Tax=Deinococcus lacus TaxID=392561 RepID=A0ABW1YEV3_9DEIO
MSEVSAIWERIEAWYGAQGASHLLNPAATPQAIADAEKALSLTFPAELKESLLRHNGTLEGHWPKGELLALERIIHEHTIWMDILQDENSRDLADHNEDDLYLQSGWWNAGWIPLDADGAGNGAAIDTAPAEDGKVGQILDMDHEVGPSGPIFDSLAEYLLAVARGLGASEYTYYKNVTDDMEGICPTEDLEDYIYLEDDGE